MITCYSAIKQIAFTRFDVFYAQKFTCVVRCCYTFAVIGFYIYSLVDLVWGVNE